MGQSHGHQHRIHRALGLCLWRLSFDTLAAGRPLFSLVGLDHCLGADSGQYFGANFCCSIADTLYRLCFFGLLLLAMSVFWIDTPASITPPVFSSTPPLGLLGLAMVFVLLTFGGWNESAYISAELKGGTRAMVWVIVISLALITLLYLLINMALLKGLGLPALAASQTAASELAQRGLGPWADRLIATLVALAALTSINATMIVGARSNYALGRDWQSLKNWVNGNPREVHPYRHTLFNQSLQWH